MTILNLIFTVLCCVGAISITAVIVAALTDYASSRKKERRKHQDSLDEIIRSMDEIIRKLK